METRTVTTDLAVAGQLTPADLPAVAAAGFRAVICNRPDGESEGQPAFAEIAAAARRAGLEAEYLPVVSGQLGQDDAVAFGQLLDTLPKPILAYCRSGTRSFTLWSLSEGARGTPRPRPAAPKVED